MFWKKKTSADDTIDYDSNDIRQAYRYHFKKEDQISVRFKGKPITLINISAGGLSFENQGFQRYDNDMIEFALEIPNVKGKASFSGGLRILSIDQTNVCHCVFEQFSLEQHELLHKYVLEMQKNDLAH